MAEVEVLQPGLYSTIQDRGRFGSLIFGVPMSGAMDRYAATMANLLLNNSQEDALLEITLSGPKLRFTGTTEIVVTGADLSPSLNGQFMGTGKVCLVQQGDILSFGGRKAGFRAYLGISGGFETEMVLNSRSWFEGITVKYRLEKGLKLQFHSFKGFGPRTFSSLKVETEYLEKEKLKVYPGPEFALLTEQSRIELISTQYTVGKNSNRMAIQLQEQLENSLQPIITGPVIPGTVQLTPSGNMIILMRDCQTTGGYPRILQLSEKAINILAQKMPGDKIRFEVSEVQ